QRIAVEAPRSSRRAASRALSPSITIEITRALRSFEYPLAIVPPRCRCSRSNLNLICTSDGIPCCCSDSRQAESALGGELTRSRQARRAREIATCRGQLLANTLRPTGYGLDAVGTVAELLSSVAVVQYDLIIVDLGLPDGDGLTAIRSLRSMGQSTPILIITARGSVEDRSSAWTAEPTTTSSSPSIMRSCWRVCAPSCDGRRRTCKALCSGTVRSNSTRRR